MNKRDYLVDCLRGYACLLVVLGHVILGIRNASIDAPLPNLELWSEYVLWSFHVALFMFLSGYVYKITGQWHGKGSRIKFILHKLLNLGIPYFFISSIYILINSVISGTNHDSKISDILYLWKTPVAQYWFIYGLFFLFLFWVVLSTVLNDIATLFALLAIIGILHITGLSLPFGGQAIAFLLVFGLGVCLPQMYLDKVNMITKVLIILVHLVIISVFFINQEISFYGLRELKQVLGIAASISIISIFMCNNNIKSFLLFIAKYSFPIYLLHTIFTAGFRVVLKKCGITMYSVHLIIGLLAGIICPIIIAKITNTNAFLDFFFYPSKSIKRIKK
ncbi:acyltransferase family protein [Butyrivibrio sp. WCD2001]|uniref:acyltransferase family protein n=1 Tax=Butyrivibrio sp. WCD2001 TaxID=1280681 RepID=UPI00042587E6|nr:acyltransferase [Butyrivibrio sp. WCD2001]